MAILQRLYRRKRAAVGRPLQPNRAHRLERIFLHIGVEKTGTTTLQVAMAINRQLLQRCGYVIPTTPEGFPSYHIGLALCAAAPDAVPELRRAARLTEAEAYSAFLESYPTTIADQLTRSGCHTAILSNEHCSSRLTTVTEIAKLHQVLAGLARECRVIIYLRRQDELVASHYSTSVRAGATDEFDFMKEIWWLDYLHMLEMWEQVFGNENVVVRVFESQQLKDGDLLADFFSTVGFVQHDKLRRPEHQNQSLDVYTVEFLRRFNMHLPLAAEPDLNGKRGAIDDALAAITTRQCLRPSAEAATAFLNRFAASNGEIARRYLHRTNGVLFTAAPLDNLPTRLPTLDVDTAIAISVGLWQWQEARLHALQKNIRAGRG